MNYTYNNIKTQIENTEQMLTAITGGRYENWKGDKFKDGKYTIDNYGLHYESKDGHREKTISDYIGESGRDTYEKLMLIQDVLDVIYRTANTSALRKNIYEIKKDCIRNEAIDWQQKFSEKSYSWAELAEKQAYFYEMGKRYGLLREFHENGIC